MADLFTLGMKVDTRDIKRGQGDLDRFARTAGDTERKVDQSTKRMGAGFNQMAGFVRVATGALAAFGAANTIKGISDAVQSMQSIQRTFTAATGSIEAGAQELAFVREEAERLGLNLESTAKSYAQLAAAAKGTTLEGEAARKVFSAVSEASTALGLSADQSEGALRALQQMMSKGTVQAEELRGQLGERIPGAFQMAARAMGVTTAELGKMLENGEVLAEDLLPKLADELSAAFGGQAEAGAVQLRAEINRMETAFFDLRVAIGESGLTDLLTDGARGATGALKAVADNLDRVDDAVTLIAAVLAARFAPAIAASTSGMIAAQVQAARYQATLASMAGVSRVAATAQLALAGAVRGASSAMALLGGPAGIVILAVGAMVAFREELGLAAKSAREFDADLGKLRDQFKGLTEQQAQASLVQMKLKLVELGDAADEANRKMAAELGSDSIGEKLNPFDKKNTDAINRATEATREYTAQMKRVAEVEKIIMEMREKPEGGPTGGVGGGADDSKTTSLRNQIALLREQQSLIAQGMSVEDAAFAAAFNNANALEREEMLLRDSIDLTIQKQKEREDAANEAAKQAEARAAEFQSVVDGLRTEEQVIMDSYNRRRDIILQNTLETGTLRAELMAKLEAETSEKLLAINGTFWERYLAAAEDALLNFDKLAESTVENFSNMAGGAFESIVFDFTSMGDAFDQVVESMARSMINAIGRMIAEWLVYQAVQAAATAAGGPAGGAGGLFAGLFDSGGTIPSGQVGIAGEFGPELIRGPANVTSREDTMAMIRGGGEPQKAPEVNLQILNVKSEDDIANYMGSDPGKRMILNALSDNPEMVRRIAGGG